MKALTVKPMTAGSARLDDVDEPPESDGPVLVQTLAVGVCGTDVEIVSGAYGWAPPGARAAWCSATSRWAVSSRRPLGAPVAAGDLVVGIVRRPDPVPCENCAVGEWDFCRNGQYTERGIKAHDGYCSERYRIHPDFAVKVDPALGAARRAARAHQRGGQGVGAGRPHRRPGATGPPSTWWSPGRGPIGLLAALLGVQRGLEVHVLDQVTSGLKPDLVAPLGASYHTGHDRGCLPVARRRARVHRRGGARVRRHGAPRGPTAWRA